MIRVRSERGMSLIEASIILMVLATLTAVIAPSVNSYANDARNVKAQEDVESIGAAIQNLMRDTGRLCLSLDGSSCATTNTGRVELLVSGSSVNAREPVVTAAALNLGAAGLASAQNLNWAGGTNEVADDRRDTIDDQFVTNVPSYTVATFTGGGGPRPGVGWRGPYLSGPVDLDPWGQMYQASTLFLVTGSDATDGTGTGQRRGGWTNDVVVLSPGSNGSIQTPFGSSTTTATGDDVVYVVQGGTH